ncbi:S8 family serine peptidase [Streptomyces flaveus]|uniref:Type VII secretion-associated serine protease n=1 Tax=Streptomyces flaveus TaxID=66370 RepID=A0A917RKK0_9ACTN|nr:S8 family serine peptidase [Streptomyces flaveus]GGL11966.1 type VII secretion-associated serine protease [Streptomyces flaveus]
MHRSLRTCAVSAACLLAIAGPSPLATAADKAPRQWYLDSMDAEGMWKVSTGKGIKVAVISTGVNPDTPSLRGQVLTGVDASVKSGNVKGSVTDTTDTTGAGTTAAELIAGTGRGGGLQGLAPGAKIIPIRVPPVAHDDAPDIRYPLLTAVKAAADSGAQIIYSSINSQYALEGLFGDSGAYKYALKKGALLIAGTGDVAKLGNKPQYPAADLDVMGVAAADQSGKVAPTSQHGEDVDMAAPGVDIPRWCDATFQRYCKDGGGTAAAAALVSASAALVWSKHPTWTAPQVWRVLQETAGRDWPVDSPSNYLGYGLVRPRQNVVHGNGQPGSAKPDYDEYWYVEPVTGASSTPSPTPTGQDAEPARGSTPSTASHESAASEGDDGLPTSGLIAGAVALTLLIGGVVWGWTRRRAS